MPGHGGFCRAIYPLGCPAPIGTSLRSGYPVPVRYAAILGLVGAGGIGTPLILAMMHYEWAAAGALLWGMVGMVTVVEIFSEWLRKKQRINDMS